MTNFYEIDFLEAGESKSGDAIALRYGVLDLDETVHVVDGGYAKDGELLRDHIKKYYGNPTYIDHVVLTHPDGDHAAGVHTILENFEIGCLWMNRPWEYVDELLPLFNYDYTRNGLIQRLRKDFPHTASLEELAEEKGIEIREVLRGDSIGEFTVLAPSHERYLQLIVDSEKTPEPEREATVAGKIYEAVVSAVEKLLPYGARKI